MNTPDASSKGEEDKEKAYDSNNIDAPLAAYVVPVLEKGVKTALRHRVAPWVQFRVWYTPYRMASPVCFILCQSRRAHA